MVKIRYDFDLLLRRYVKIRIVLGGTKITVRIDSEDELLELDKAAKGSEGRISSR